MVRYKVYEAVTTASLFAVMACLFELGTAAAVVGLYVGVRMWLG